MLYDVIQVWMAARHDNGDKVLHTLVHHHFAFEEKQFALFCSRKPAQEQAVAHGLLVVGTVAQIEHDVGIGAEHANLRIEMLYDVIQVWMASPDRGCRRTDAEGRVPS